MTRPTTPPPAWSLRAAALLFVLLWSSAFVATRAGLPDASPLLFLTLRFALASAVLLLVLRLLGVDLRPLRRHAGHLAIAGTLINGAYLAGAYLAMTRVNAATMALIGALHPLFTAVLAWPLLAERVGRLQLFGLALGLCGVVVVVAEDVTRPGDLGVALLGLGGVVALALGTIHYRRHCREVPIHLANLLQLAAAAIFCGVLTLTVETPRFAATPTALASLLYLALVVSLGAQVLLMLLLRHGAASKVASNFYLTPGTTAVIGWLVLGEAMAPAALAGLAISSLGVWLAQRPAARSLRAGAVVSGKDTT